MKDKLRDLAGEMRNELCSDFAQKLEAILDAEGDGGAVEYFSANPAEGEFSTHKSLAEAVAGAESLLEYAQDEASDWGWTDEPPQICYGVVLGGCIEKEGSRRPAPEGSDFSETVDFELTSYAHPARSGVVRDEDVDLAVLAHHTWCKDAGFTGYVTCRGAMRAALEHFAKGSSEDVRDAPELFSGTKDALSNLSIHKSYQEKTS